MGKLAEQKSQSNRYKGTATLEISLVAKCVDREVSSVNKALNFFAYMQENGLTERETEVAEQLAQGHTVKHIANKYCISQYTVRNHRSSLYKKLHIHSREDLVRLYCP